MVTISINSDQLFLHLGNFLLFFLFGGGGQNSGRVVSTPTSKQEGPGPYCVEFAWSLLVSSLRNFPHTLVSLTIKNMYRCLMGQGLPWK